METETQSAPAYLRQWGCGEEISRAHALIRSAAAVVVVDMVPDGGGVGGHASEVGLTIILRTVATETQRAPAYLRQWGCEEDTSRAHALIRSAAAAIGDGHDRHG